MSLSQIRAHLIDETNRWWEVFRSEGYLKNDKSPTLSRRVNSEFGKVLPSRKMTERRLFGPSQETQLQVIPSKIIHFCLDWLQLAFHGASQCQSLLGGL